MKVLAGQGPDLVCCAVSAELDLVASVSRSRGLVLHSLMGGRFLRCLPHLRCADLVALSPEGLVVLWTRRQRLLRVFTLNGTRVASVRVAEEDGDVSALCVSLDGTHLALGTDCSRARQRRERQRERERIMAAAAAGRSAGVLLRARPKDRPPASAAEQAAAETREGEGQQQQWDLWDSLARGAGDAHPTPLPGRSAEPREWREGDEGVSKKERGAAVSLLDIYTLKASVTGPGGPPACALTRARHCDEWMPSGSAEACCQLPDLPCPCVTLQALIRFPLPENTDVTALALSPDNTNIVCSASVTQAVGQLILYSNPVVRMGTCPLPQQMLP